jgi:hypothetical protein
MIAAQLIAAHNATMERYRRAMLGDQTLEGRRDNLSQANKLSRTYATLLEALSRYRGKGQQKVTVEHVHVHSGGQAVVGVVEATGGRGRINPRQNRLPMHRSPRCGARTRSGGRCRRRQWPTAVAACTADCQQARPRACVRHRRCGIAVRAPLFPGG